MINIIGSSRYKVNKKSLESHIRSLYTQKDITQDTTLNVVFVGKRKMTSIAAKYKHENEALPVLAFPYKGTDTEDHLLGEIFLCYSQLVLMAAHRNRTVEEIINEMVEHGLKNVIS